MTSDSVQCIKTICASGLQTATKWWHFRLVVEGNQSESKNLQSGMTGGRPVCVRWAGNGTVIG